MSLTCTLNRLLTALRGGPSPRHLGSCPSCREEHEFERAIGARLREEAAERFPPTLPPGGGELHHRVLRAVREQAAAQAGASTSRPDWGGLGLAAACALLLVAGLALSGPGGLAPTTVAPGTGPDDVMADPGETGLGGDDRLPIETEVMNPDAIQHIVKRFTPPPSTGPSQLEAAARGLLPQLQPVEIRIKSSYTGEIELLLEDAQNTVNFLASTIALN